MWSLKNDNQWLIMIGQHLNSYTNFYYCNNEIMKKFKLIKILHFTYNSEKGVHCTVYVRVI